MTVGRVRGAAAIVRLPLPAWTKDRAHLRQGFRDGSAWFLGLPWRYVRAVLRGLVVVARWWRAWVTVRDFRQAAEQQDKLADKFREIRELTLLRYRMSAGLTVLSASTITVLDVLYGDLVWWAVAAVFSSVLAMTGRRRDGSPGRKAVLPGPRSLAWTVDPLALAEAFRDARLIGKDESLRLVERPIRQGAGWAVTVDLPATRKAADVIRSREALASALAVDELQLVVERVRGNGGHAGRVAMWVADSDPYDKPVERTPLRVTDRWDAWRPVPFGRDARGRQVDLPLVWTSLLVGAIPRQGKTFAARLAVAGLVLDPYTRLYVADFKAGKDWDAAGSVAHRFMSGDDAAHVLELVGWLAELTAEIQARYRRMRTMDDVVCPESKVTPAMSRDKALGMPITAVVIDEVQVPLEDHTIVDVASRRMPVGEHIGEQLTWLAKKGPAAGLVLVLATQRPDSKTIPSGLRAVLGSRFALRVMDWRDSNIVLGEQMNTRGYDASRLLPSHKGVGILRPDGETSGDVLATTVRTFYMPNDDWRAICEQGRAQRVDEGTLTGHANGEPAPTETVHTVVSAPIPAVLAQVVEFVDHHGDGRDFIPTAELAEALGLEAGALGRQMSDHGCASTRDRITTADGVRQVRGYLVPEIRDAVDRLRAASPDDTSPAIL
ncbi:FtsK/SpoIIIE domain-containing protein [Actinokineospora inagensis]|uniref:FtsK/SpoIIIE domain-containing protein n=1 Tax=Actinokineospora inagensis TaxID=103730 RepID=UPI000405745E|nr:FtsK/SpoIIIE domain-containing protein [Actinokineospora inagensis]